MRIFTFPFPGKRPVRAAFLLAGLCAFGTPAAAVAEGLDPLLLNVLQSYETDAGALSPSSAANSIAAPLAMINTTNSLVTHMPRFAQRGNAVIQTALLDSLMTGDDPARCSSSACWDYQRSVDLPWRISAAPVYLSGTDSSLSYDVDHTYRGFGMGFGRSFSRGDFALGAYYLDTIMKSPSNRTTGDGFGGIGALSFVLGSAEDDPRLEFRGGYGRFTFDQDRQDTAGPLLASSLDADVYNAGVSLSAKICLSEDFSITPKIGAEYAYVKMNSGREDGNPQYARLFSGFNRDYLFGKVGLRADYAATDGLRLRGRVFYTRQFMDDAVKSSSRRLAAPGVLTTEEWEEGSSLGQVGAGFEYIVSKVFSFGLDYDFFIGDSFSAHMGSATFKIRW